MKWIAAILMIVNVAVYLWASGKQAEPVAIENLPSPDVNREGMLLFREAGGQKQLGSVANKTEPEAGLSGSGESISSEPKTNEDGTADLDDARSLIITEDLLEDSSREIELSAVSQEQQVQIQKQCIRIGPFKKSEPWNNAQQWVVDQGAEFRPITSESRELRAVRVFLGPFTSDAAVAETRSLLKDKNLDHFVYQVENGATRVSLGYFTQEELANKFLNYLGSINIDAKSQSEYRKLGPFNWMEIAASDISSQALESHHWGESSVRLSVLGCS